MDRLGKTADMNPSDPPAEVNRDREEVGLVGPQMRERVERELREREIAVKEAEQKLKEQDFAFRRDESRRSRWGSPLVIAIFTAAAAAIGNAVVALVNGWQEQELERTRAEATRILEMIKTGDPDKAAENLGFLSDAGLIEDPQRIVAIREFLARRKPGGGPSLPFPIPTPAPPAQNP